MSHQVLLRPIRDWLIQEALGDPDIVEMFGTACQRLAGIGVPIRRARLIWQTLHPLFQAETVIWDLGEEARLDQFPHQDEATDAWKVSPLRFVLENELAILRRRLDGPDETIDFPMLQELKAEGITDYLVLATAIENFDLRRDENSRNPRGIVVTWSSDRPAGFSDDDLAALQSVQQILAIACKTVIQSRITVNIASTYLGMRAGRNVLDGQIRRGDGAETNAVVWFSDLRNSTMLAESMASDSYFAMLNAYFEATAGPVVHHGGEVLDFIGDAVLGIFPYDNDEELLEAAKGAHAALDQSVKLAEEANSAREAEGQERFKYGVGLNVGTVQFGNIGIPERLSFSVIGPTVNEVSRIEGMTKLLQKPILGSKALARLVPERWRSVGEHKLPGVLEPVELFTFEIAP